LANCIVFVTVFDSLPHLAAPSPLWMKLGTHFRVHGESGGVGCRLPWHFTKMLRGWEKKITLTYFKENCWQAVVSF